MVRHVIWSFGDIVAVVTEDRLQLKPRTLNRERKKEITE